MDVISQNFKSNFYRTIDFMRESNTELITLYQPRGTAEGKWKQYNNISYPVRANKDGLLLVISKYYVNCSLSAGGKY